MVVFYRANLMAADMAPIGELVGKFRPMRRDSRAAAKGKAAMSFRSRSLSFFNMARMAWRGTLKVPAAAGPIGLLRGAFPGFDDLSRRRRELSAELVVRRQALVVTFSTPVVFRDGRSPLSWPPRVKGEGSPAFQPAGRSGRLHAVGHWPRAGSPVLAMTFIRRSIKSLSP